MSDLLKPVDAFATLATSECIEELSLFLTSLRRYHCDTPIYVATTSEVLSMLSTNDVSSKHLSTQRQHPRRGAAIRNIKENFFQHDANIMWVPLLDAYGTIARTSMERQKGVLYPTRHCDFMMEKATIMEHAMMEEELKGSIGERPMVLFLDCDVCTLQPWPAAPASCSLLLSHHRIRQSDESAFGVYNGGVVGIRDPLALYQWKKLTRVSRYFDQASLEDVDDWCVQRDGSSVCYYGPHVNYGYWRMFQHVDDVPHHKDRSDVILHTELPKFSLATSSHGDECLLMYEGQPLQSVHTHFFVDAQRQSSVTMPLFNKLMMNWMAKSATGSYRHILRLVMT